MYKVNAPPCVAENAAENAAKLAERAAARERRAAHLAAVLAGEKPPAADVAAADGGAPAEAEAASDGGAEGERPRPRPLVPPPLAQAAVRAFERAHAASDAVGLTDVVAQAGAAARLGRDAARDAAAAAAAALNSCRLRARGGQPNTPASPSSGAAGGPSDSDDEAYAPIAPDALADRSAGIALECKEAGNVAFKKGRYEAALRSYTRACELDPRVAIYHANRAAALLALQRPADAARACVAALAVDGACGRARQRLAVVCTQAGAVDVAADAADAALQEQPSSGALRALAAQLRTVALARAEGKAYYDKGEYALAETAYTRGLNTLAEGLPVGAPPAPGDALLRCNRAAARLALGRHADALEDADAALAVEPQYDKALARRAAAVKCLGDAARAAARSERDALVAELRAKGVAVPEPAEAAAQGDAAWGRAQCAECCELGRDALACRASFRHRAPDVEPATWRRGGRVRFARRAAAVARGTSLGAGLAPAPDAASTAASDDLTVVGTITGFDWPSGLHAVARDFGKGTLHVRLRAAHELQYTPPPKPALPA